MASKITIDTSRLLPAAEQTSAGRGGAIVKSNGSGIVRSLGQSFSGAVQEITNVRERQQQQTFSFLSKQLQAINNNILAVANNITALTSALQTETRKEEANIQQEKTRRIRSAEKESFGRAESILESRIVRAITKPVKKITGAVQGGLNKLKDALMLLFVGWLTDKVFKMFQADADGSTNKFEELKTQIGVALAAAGGAFALLSGGLLGIIATIGGLSLSIAGFLIKQPFKWLKNLFFPAKQPPVTPGGGKGGRVTPGSGGGGRTGGGRAGGGTSGGGGGGRTSPGGRTTPPQTGGGIFGGIWNKAKSLIPQPIRAAAGGGWQKVKGFFGKPLNAVKGMGRGILPFLGRLLGVASFVLGARDRMNRGQSPTQAVLGFLPEFLLTYGGASIGLGAGALAGGGILSALLAVAGAGLGGAVGSMLGQPITDLIDSSWQPGWDKALGFINDPIRNALEGMGVITKSNLPTPSASTSTSAKPSQTGEMPEVQPVVTPPAGRLDSLISPPSTAGRAADLAQRGPAEGMPTYISLDTATITGDFAKKQSYPKSPLNMVPAVPTSDPLNPYSSLANSIYNIGV